MSGEKNYNLGSVGPWDDTEQVFSGSRKGFDAMKEETDHF